MNQTLAAWLLIVLALFCANLPFLNERVLGVIAWRRAGQDGVKPLWVRLLEVVVLYAIVGGLGWAFESALGNPFAQRGEFYAVTFSLFLVLAYPGFVYRYLFRRHGKLRVGSTSFNTRTSSERHPGR